MDAAIGLLGHDVTYSSQLDAVGKQWFGAQWGGVHSRSGLPVAVSPERRGYVVNTHDGQGRHWCACLDDGEQRYFSDPLGQVGTQQRAALAALHPHALWSHDDPEMAVDASICGPAALAAVAVGLRHGPLEFMQI